MGTLTDKRHAIQVTGGLARYNVPIPTSKRRTVSSPRGLVREFSRQSRMRLMRLFASLDYRLMDSAGVSCLFLTLTTPPVVWDDSRHLYKSLRRFQLRLTRLYGSDWSAIAKRELGAKSGMPHYHVVFFGIDRIDARWLRETWAECLRVPEARAQIEEVRGASHVARYLSKYVAKVGYEGAPRVSATEGAGARGVPSSPVVGEGVEETPGGGVACITPPCNRQDEGSADEETPAETGVMCLSLSKAHNCTEGDSDGITGSRWWYVWNKENLPLAESEVVELEKYTDMRELQAAVKRIFRGWMKSKAYEKAKRQIEGGDAVALLQQCGISVSSYAVKVQRRETRAYWRRAFKGSYGWTMFGSPDFLSTVVEFCILQHLEKRGNYAST